jgi:integrase/recombinase XerD
MAETKNELPLFSQVSGEIPAATLRSDSSLSAAIAAWREDLEKSGRSIHTVKAFSGDLKLFAKFISGGNEISEIGTHDIRNFLDWMLNRRGVPCSPKTYARRITSIKAFFRWLKAAGILVDDPATAIPQQSVLSPLPEVLTSTEVDAVLDAANASRNADQPDARPYALAALLLNTGIKKGECLAIHLNHVDLHAEEGSVLWIRYGDVGKRYRERKLALSEDWIASYQEYLGQYAPEERLFPYSPRRLEYLLEDLGEAAGLSKHLSFNMCRWTAALADYMSGMEADRIRQKLGISKIQWREIGKKLDKLAAKSRG